MGRIRNGGAELFVVEPVEFAALVRIDENGKCVAADRVLMAPGREVIRRIGRQLGGGDRSSQRKIGHQGYLGRQHRGDFVLADADGFHSVDVRGRDLDAAQLLHIAVPVARGGGYADGSVTRALGLVEREAFARGDGLPRGGRSDGEGFGLPGLAAQYEVVCADGQRRGVLVVAVVAGGWAGDGEN